jgi:hypothetical protein
VTKVGGVILELKEQQERLEAAFRALPIKRPADPDRLSYESAIPMIARSLARMRSG